MKYDPENESAKKLLDSLTKPTTNDETESSKEDSSPTPNTDGSDSEETINASEETNE